MDTDALFTGSLEVLKRCQRKPDIDLSITIQDVKNACKKFNIDVL